MTESPCLWQPDPTHGPPPPCWVRATAARHRLDHACTVLRHHGIVACAALDRDPVQGRSRVHAALAVRPGPAGTEDGSYMFWTLPDDLDCFTVDGTLIAALPLYVNGPVVADAVLGVLGQVGLAADVTESDDVVVVAAQ